MSKFPANDDPARETSGKSRQIAGRDRPVGIVFTDSRASGCFEDRLSAVTTLHGAGFSVREGTLEQRPIVVLLASKSPREPALAVDALIAGHRPAWVIAAGLAHGLDDRLRRGNVLIADRILNSALDQELTVAWPHQAAQLKQIQFGRLVSVARPLRLPTEKRDLGRHSAALAADSAAFEICEACGRENILFFAVHVIADAVDDRLPADVAHWAGRPSLARRLGAMAGALVHRPGSAKDMWNYYESSVAAAATLAKALAELIRLLA